MTLSLEYRKPSHPQATHPDHGDPNRGGSNHGHPDHGRNGSDRQLSFSAVLQQFDIVVLENLAAQQQFIEELFNQLHKQAGLAERGAGAHPDLSIREFNQGLYQFLQTEAGARLKQIFLEVWEIKKDSPDHMVDLIARVVQHLIRRQSAEDNSYTKLTAQDWENYLASISDVTIEEIRQLLIEKQVSTHVLSRYRGVAALAAMMQQTSGRKINFVDLGCSCNLGSGLASRPNVLLNETSPPLVVDETPDQIVTQLLRTPEVGFDQITGVDLSEVELDWAMACAYFGKYDQEKGQLMQARELLSTKEIPLITEVGDIASAELWKKLIDLQGSNEVDIIHASMVLYQLTPADVQACLDHACQSLSPCGCFIELTFIDRSTWFGNKDNGKSGKWEATIQSTVRFKTQDGQFTKPLQWLVWDNSRCGMVRPGEDFKEVMSMLAAQG